MSGVGTTSAVTALALVLLAACASPQVDDFSQNPYYSLCRGAIIDPDVGAYLGDHGIDAMQGLADLGSTDWLVRGDRAERFRARTLVWQKIEQSGWQLGWPADSIILMDEWDVLGFEKGPWVRLASVEHRRLPTEQIIEQLQGASIPTYFFFGEFMDLIFVNANDRLRADMLLKGEPNPAVKLLDGKMCEHTPPPVIRRGEETRFTIHLSTGLRGKPLGERVSEVTLTAWIPGNSAGYGWLMRITESSDTSLTGTYDLPPLPPEASGFVQYDFTFKLDGRSYSHGWPGKSFRVPIE